MEFADADAGVVGDVEERELHEVLCMEAFAVEKVRDKHFKEMVVGNDHSLARTLAREDIETFPRAFLHVGEVLLVGEAIIILVVREVHLVDDVHYSRVAG